MSRLVVLCALLCVWMSVVTASNFNTNFLSLNQPIFARSPVESDEELYRLAATFAPKIYLQSSEKNLPSDIQYFLDNTQLLCNGLRPANHPARLDAYNLDFNGPSDGCRLVTLEDLGCPSCTNPPFLGGFNPTQKSVPVYVFVVDKDEGVKDLIYFTFYPYNNGKNVCVGYYFDNVCPCFKVWGNCVCPRINGCAGGYSSFGNHVGDWEHVTVRLVNGVPSQVYLSEHSHGETHNWGAGSLQYEGSHPIAYSAYGSHALYGSPGRHTYQNLPNGDSLNDDTDAGIPWNTWENMVIIRYSEHYEGDKAWLNYRGDWGNDKAGCGVIEYLSGECVLNGGPSGPPTKGFLTSQQLD